MATKIHLFVVLYILSAHWICDFIFQTDSQAKGKSKSWAPLLAHTSIYSGSMMLFFGLLILMAQMKGESEVPSILTAVWFGLITFVCHTVQDYFTSRVNSRLWGQQRVHAFFVSVGFDQLLHFVQLLTTVTIYLFNPTKMLKSLFINNFKELVKFM